ncbi:MAG: tetratricopeptide repeat protein [Dehalococcoidia bacterium]
MKKLLALAVVMAAIGAAGALIALRILSRPRVAPAPFGPDAPLPPISELPIDEEPDDPRLELEELRESAEGAPGMLTESGVVLPEEVLADERDEGMPAPLAAVAEPMGELGHDLASHHDVNGRGGAPDATLADSIEVTDEPPSHHTPPPVSEVVGEPEGMASDIADVEPSHHTRPPVSEVTGEHVEQAIEAEDAMALPVTEAIAQAASEAETAVAEGDFLTNYFEQLARQPAAEAVVETVVAEVSVETAPDEALPESVEEALATLPGQNIAALGQRDAESHLDEGNVYFNVGQYGLAIERYGKAIELAPELIAAYYNRANARTRAGEYDGALADYNDALRLQPNDPDALNNRGMLHLYRASYPEALQDFNAALAIDPADTTVMVNRGLAHLHGGDAAAALVDFREATSLDNNDAAAHYGAGQAAATLGNRDESLRHVSRALEIDPAYAREAAADPKLQALQGDDEFMRLLRESGTRAERP